MALFGKSRKKAAPGNRAPAYPEGRRMYCIGDIHGRADLLQLLLDWIRRDAENHDGDRQVLYLGDFIDRGERSKEVIDLLLAPPLPGFESIHLIGNHEYALLEFLADPVEAAGWLSWGGRETLSSYGILCPLAPSPTELCDLRDRFEAVLPAAHRDFLEDCVLHHAEGDYYFVHAGIRPGVPLDRQDFQDQLWIRHAFTESTDDHGAVVVHGHTISEQAELLPNRIGIDTGAYATGVLTCLVLEGTEQRLIQTGGAD